jgi:hypothetical protein
MYLVRISADTPIILNEIFRSVPRLVHHVMWVPCHHGTARPHIADGEDGLQIWSVAANILNKQSRTADKGWSCSMEVGRRAINSSP